MAGSIAALWSSHTKAPQLWSPLQAQSGAASLGEGMNLLLSARLCPHKGPANRRNRWHIFHLAGSKHAARVLWRRREPRKGGSAAPGIVSGDGSCQHGIFLCKEKPNGHSGLHRVLQPSDLHHIYLPARHPLRDFLGLFLQKYSGYVI